MAVLGLMALGGSAAADHNDHLKARQLHKSGDIVAVEKILDRAQKIHPGRVIEVDLNEQGGRYLYEVELVDSKGEVRVLFFDANTGEQAKGNFKHH